MPAEQQDSVHVLERNVQSMHYMTAGIANSNISLLQWRTSCSTQILLSNDNSASSVNMEPNTDRHVVSCHVMSRYVTS